MAPSTPPLLATFRGATGDGDHRCRSRRSTIGTSRPGRASRLLLAPGTGAARSVVAGEQPGDDGVRALGRAGHGGVHDQVVTDSLVHTLRLEAGHPDNPVRPGPLAGGGDPGRASYTNPHHGQPGQGRRRRPVLRHPAPHEDLVEDEARTSAAYRREPWYQAASARRKSSPTVTDPSDSKSMDGPASTGSSTPGSARMRSSTPSVSQVGPSRSCRRRAMDDLPELEPPFRTTTSAFTPWTLSGHSGAAPAAKPTAVSTRWSSHRSVTGTVSRTLLDNDERGGSSPERKSRAPRPA